MLTIGSLFSGYGGLDAGIQQVVPAQVVWHSDIKPAAVKLLAHQWPDVPNLGDITTIDWSQVERPDIVTGGFPCTDVSLAGARAGLHSSTRSGLFAEMLLSVATLRPALVVIENVRGLLSARGAEPTPELLAAWAERDRLTRVIALIESKANRASRNGEMGHIKYHQRDRVRIMGQHRRAVAAVKRADRRIIRAIGTVLGSLADIGYDAAWYGLPASAVGAPHGRFRVFIIAWPARDAEKLGRHEGTAPERGGGPEGAPRRSGLAPANTAHIGHERDRGTRDGRDGSPDNGLADAITPRSGRSGVDDRPGGPGARRSGQRVAGGSLGVHAAPDTEGIGRNEGRPEPTGVVGGPEHAFSGATFTDTGGGGCDGWARDEIGQTVERVAAAGGSEDAPADADSARREGDRAVASGQELPDADGDQPATDWAIFGPAIRRWEAVLGRPAPAPTQTGPSGGQRLSPLLTEWMMGLPAGHITDVPRLSRNDMLSLAGDGVVPQQAAAAIRHLLAATESVRAA